MHVDSAPSPGHGAPIPPGHGLHHVASHAAARYYISAPPGVRPALDGLFDPVEVAPGLNLLRVDVRDMQGVALQGRMEPGLRLACVVGGRSDVTYGDRRIVLGPLSQSRLHCSMVSVCEPEPFVRRSRRGDRERTVALTLTPQWLEHRLSEPLRSSELLLRHLSSCTWRISTQTLTLAEQLLRPPELSPALMALYLESRALDIVVDALAYLEKVSRHRGPLKPTSARTPALAPATLRERERQRMNEVRDLLDSGQADAWSLDQIAQQVCVSVNTLQRHFRLAWGKTVFAYLRDSRLMRARVAMERDGISVTLAADVAGYTSAANFATAFRKHFGITPCQVRTRG